MLESIMARAALVDMQTVDDLVCALNECTERTRRDAALETGAIVFSGVFGADAERLARRGRRAAAYRALVAHPRIALSARAVWSSVLYYRNHETLAAHVRDALPFRLQVALVAVEEPRRSALAELAAAERWSLRALQERLAAERPRRGGGASAPAGPVARPGRAGASPA